MDLKQKYENAKAKFKENAPVIAQVSSVIAIAATTTAAILYAQLKKDVEAMEMANDALRESNDWIRGHKEFGICSLSEEKQAQLKEGSGAVIYNYGSSDDNYCLMYCDETHIHGNPEN